MKADCEFCGRRHNKNNVQCPLRTAEYPDGNNLEKGGKQIKLRDLYDMLEHKRILKFEVMINKEMGFDPKGLSLNSDITSFLKGGKAGKKLVSLDSCFASFS